MASKVFDNRYETDVHWRQLPNAPFSPRADVQVIVQEMSLYKAVLHFIGGQTNHHCVREFGQCVSELWTAELTWDSNADQLIELQWMSREAVQLPISARCGAALLGLDIMRREDAVPISDLRHLVGILGGQLSYFDTTCRSSPVALNDTYYAITPLINASSAWYQGPDAPFTARRSQRLDSYFTHMRLTQDKQAELLLMPSATLVGGMRIISHRLTGSLQTVLTAVEMFADVWECTFPKIVHFNRSHCNWMEPAKPADSVPLPVVGGPYQWASGGIGGAQIGGQSSLAGITALRNALPRLDWEVANVDLSQLKTNMTLIIDPRFGEQPLNMKELMEARQYLPLSFVLDEAELTSDSPYTLGADWVVSRYMFALTPWDAPQASTAHHQPLAFADTPAQSTQWVYQAESSRNTTRPLFNFPLRRFGHGSSLRTFHGVWGYSALSAGRSGDTFYNDWITLCSQGCMPVDDPLYRQSLGRVEPVRTQADVQRSYQPGHAISARCGAGLHWEPPAKNDQVSLQCGANGMWMNYELMTVQSCQPDTHKLNCTHPLVDRGFEKCEVVTPRITGLSLESSTNLDNVTIAGALVNGGQVLTIYGSYFTQPLAVLVGGLECMSVELWLTGNDTTPVQLCQHQVNNRTVCQAFADQVRCSIPAVFGLRLPVEVIDGFSFLLADVYGSETGAATISSTAPVILQLESAACVSPDSLTLRDCPATRPFNITVFAQAASMSNADATLVFLGPRALGCGEWMPDMGSPDRAIKICLVHPQLGTSLPLTLAQPGIIAPAISFSALLTFQSCSAGTFIDLQAAASGTSSLCTPCAPGFTSLAGQYKCDVCRPGSFANKSGLAACLLCEPGQYMANTNATVCLTCPPNSRAEVPGSSACVSCPSNTYIRYTDRGSNTSRSHGDCLPCPDGAVCDMDVGIVAGPGTFLLIDQETSSASGVGCSASACQSPSDSDSCPTQSTAPQLIARSQLAVVNCCAEGRYPAYDPDNPDLADTGGENVLCARCLPGYATSNGRCIQCASVHWAPLVGKTLVALVLIYLLHRLPHDWSGSASVAISTYFLQLSMLFLASEALPPVLTLINLSVAGDHLVRGSNVVAGVSSGSGLFVGGCTVPLSDYERIVQSLLSPLIAFALLGVILVVQLLLRSKLNRQANSSASQRTPSHAAADPSEAVDSRHRSRYTAVVYQKLFTPSPVKVSEQTPVSLAAAMPGLQSPLLSVHSARTADDQSVGVDGSLQSGNCLATILLWYQRTAVRLLLLSYIPLSSVALSFFSLRAVGQYGRRLTDYQSISPDSQSYARLIVPVAFVLAGVVCGLPLLLLASLAREHRCGNIARMREEAAVGRWKDGTMDGSVVALADGTTLSTSRAMLVLQLCAMYRPQYWWYGVFTLARRLVLVAVLVFVPDASVWIWLSLVNTLLLTLHLVLQPYSQPGFNAKETTTLLSMTVQTMLLSRYPPPYMSAGLLGVLGLLVMGPALLLLGDELWKKWIRRQASKLRRAQRDDGFSDSHGRL